MTPAALAQLHGAAFGPAEAWGEGDFAGLLAQRGVMLVAEPGAFLLGRVVADEGEVLTLATDPAQRRRGMARGLLARFAQAAAAGGAVSLFLEVAADNTAARALYAQAGFVQVGLRRGYYAREDGHAADALVLRKVLQPVAAEAAEAGPVMPPMQESC